MEENGQDLKVRSDSLKSPLYNIKSMVNLPIIIKIPQKNSMQEYWVSLVRLVVYLQLLNIQNNFLVLYKEISWKQIKH